MENALTVRREPAVFLALLASLVQIISSFIFPITDEQQSLLNGAFAVIAGGITAAMVGLDKLLPLLAGIVQAVLSVAVGFGLEMTNEQQSILMAFVAALVGIWGVRPQVEAKISKDGQALVVTTLPEDRSLR
jgi:hypothetical protein